MFPLLHDKSEYQTRIIIVSGQQALLGEVLPNIRTISGRISGNLLTMVYCIDGIIDSSIEKAAIKVKLRMSSLLPNYHIEIELKRKDYPEIAWEESSQVMFYARWEYFDDE